MVAGDHDLACRLAGAVRVITPQGVFIRYGIGMFQVAVDLSVVTITATPTEPRPRNASSRWTVPMTLRQSRDGSRSLRARAACAAR